jgi:hypothetical protein
VGPADSFPGIKLEEREANYSPPPAEAKMLEALPPYNNLLRGIFEFTISVLSRIFSIRIEDL